MVSFASEAVLRPWINSRPQAQARKCQFRALRTSTRRRESFLSSIIFPTTMIGCKAVQGPSGSRNRPSNQPIFQSWRRASAMGTFPNPLTCYSRQDYELTPFAFVCFSSTEAHCVATNDLRCVPHLGRLLNCPGGAKGMRVVRKRRRRKLRDVALSCAATKVSMYRAPFHNG